MHKTMHHLCTLIFFHLNRKLKKLVRTLKDKESVPKESEEEKPHQWNLDYALAPYEGLTPEYMEMSECARRQRGRAGKNWEVSRFQQVSEKSCVDEDTVKQWCVKTFKGNKFYMKHQ